MSTSQTTNLHLVKPDDSEYPDVSVINGNMDTIDAKIGAVGNTSLQAQISQLISNGVVDDLDNISTYLCKSAQNASNMPSGLNSNTCFVITLVPDKNATYNVQLAFSFGASKLAMRTRQGHISSGAWSEWKYATLS